MSASDAPCGQLSVTSAVEPTSTHLVLTCQRHTWCAGAGAERSPGPPPALPARPGRGHCPARFPGHPPAPAPLKCCFSPPRPSLGGGSGGWLEGRDLSRRMGGEKVKDDGARPELLAHRAHCPWFTPRLPRGPRLAAHCPPLACPRGLRFPIGRPGPRSQQSRRGNPKPGSSGGAALAGRKTRD